MTTTVMKTLHGIDLSLRNDGKFEACIGDKVVVRSSMSALERIVRERTSTNIEAMLLNDTTRYLSPDGARAHAVERFSLVTVERRGYSASFRDKAGRIVKVPHVATLAVYDPEIEEAWRDEMAAFAKAWEEHERALRDILKRATRVTATTFDGAESAGE